jgi:hypothetical protein
MRLVCAAIGASFPLNFSLFENFGVYWFLVRGRRRGR